MCFLNNKNFIFPLNVFDAVSLFYYWSKYSEAYQECVITAANETNEH